jgi:hypothetical protein
MASEPDEVPAILREVGFDFHWDERKVWALEVPVEEVDIDVLRWHLDVPFLGRERPYDLTPREVLADPAAHREEYARTMRADLAHPIDVMWNKGRWLILDGLHRLMKAHATGSATLRVRRIPRELIPRIST